MIVVKSVATPGSVCGLSGSQDHHLSLKSYNDDDIQSPVLTALIYSLSE